MTIATLTLQTPAFTCFGADLDFIETLVSTLPNYPALNRESTAQPEKPSWSFPEEEEFRHRMDPGPTSPAPVPSVWDCLKSGFYHCSPEEAEEIRSAVADLAQVTGYAFKLQLVVEEVAGFEAAFRQSNGSSDTTFFKLLDGTVPETFDANLDVFRVRRASFAEENQRMADLLAEEDPFQLGRARNPEPLWYRFETTVAQRHAQEVERLRRCDQPEAAARLMALAEASEAEAEDEAREEAAIAALCYRMQSLNY